MLMTKRPSKISLLSAFYRKGRGTLNGSIANIAGERNRSSDRLSCTAVAACPSSRVRMTERE